MDGSTFDILILTGRPASGKSGILDHLIRTPPARRRSRFDVGAPGVLDGFSMLRAWFEVGALPGQKPGRQHS